VEVDAAELAMLLAGIDAKSVKRRKRYSVPVRRYKPQIDSCMKA